MNDPGCESCPVAAGCIARRTGHLRYCEWARQGIGLDRIRELSAEVPDPGYPPVATQLGNALGAALRFAGSGFATAGAEEYDRRKAICEACEHFDAGPQRCRQCGCAVAVKAWSKAERCPVGKW